MALFGVVTHMTIENILASDYSGIARLSTV